MTDKPIKVGDRVEVSPQSAGLHYLEGEKGTVERVLEDDGRILSGALYVRLDCDGEVLGIGPNAVILLPPAPTPQRLDRTA